REHLAAAFSDQLGLEGDIDAGAEAVDHPVRLDELSRDRPAAVVAAEPRHGQTLVEGDGGETTPEVPAPDGVADLRRAGVLANGQAPAHARCLDSRASADEALGAMPVRCCN